MPSAPTSPPSPPRPLPTRYGAVLSGMAVLLLIASVVVACSTETSPGATSALPRDGEFPALLGNPAVLPAMYVPSEEVPAHGGVVAAADAACRYAFTTCIPPGVYQQQASPGDWCSWHYYPAAYRRGEAGHETVVANWRDADGQLVTLQEGDELSYGPTTGALRFTDGLPNTEGWHGDGVPRGCAEWVQVAPLPADPRPPRPTVEECVEVAATGEVAAEELQAVASTLGTELEQRLTLADAALAHIDAGSDPDAYDFVGTLHGVVGLVRESMEVILAAEPKLLRARECYELLGDIAAADFMSGFGASARRAWGAIRTMWGDLQQECPESYAPSGFDCSLLAG